MTSIAMQLHKIYEELVKVADEARTKGYKEEEWFRRVGEAAERITGALTLMRIYGEIDPEEFKEIEKSLFGK
ncbi:MAG: hypothetical protein AOA65_0958 [Candidatus Bathyarchaeota archaeon BA1]|nr:MAG: hypothetical protein AOA65_0958 [Candidatus Bathyarchaeota archaeon BA1]